METDKPHIVPKYVLYGFFTLGLLSALSFRSIIIFQRMRPAWVRPIWYLAVTGYFLFFYYRYKISKKRKHAVRDYDLLVKVDGDRPLSAEDREVLKYLLSSIHVSLEDRNYALIFLLSLAAIGIDLLLILYYQT